MSETVSFKFFINESVTRGNECKIYGRIRVNRKKAEFSTNFFVLPQEWQSDTGRCAKNPYINEDLLEIEARINRIRRKLEDDEKTVSARAIAEIYKGKRSEKINLLDYIDTHILDMRAMK